MSQQQRYDRAVQILLHLLTTWGDPEIGAVDVNKMLDNDDFVETVKTYIDGPGKIQEEALQEVERLRPFEEAGRCLGKNMARERCLLPNHNHYTDCEFQKRAALCGKIFGDSIPDPENGPEHDSHQFCARFKRHEGDCSEEED